MSRKSRSKKHKSKKHKRSKHHSPESSDNRFDDIHHAKAHMSGLDHDAHPTREEYHAAKKMIKQHDHESVFDAIGGFFGGKSKKHEPKEPKAKEEVSSDDDDLHFMGKTRRTWKNQSATQVVQPLRLLKPSTLEDLVQILEECMENDVTCRAVGSGHSYSDCVHTDGFLLETWNLKRYSKDGKPFEGQLFNEQLRPGNLEISFGPMHWDDYDPMNNRCLIELQCGVRLRNLTKILEKRNLGLPNMGGFDGQTIVGVTSTATHGSGISIPCLSDIIHSLVLVTTGYWRSSDKDNVVNIYRIEPKNGITDPDNWNHPQIKLIQNDDAFYSSICNMGCFGLIYSVVIEVNQLYYLDEVREIVTLDEIMDQLRPNPNNPGCIPDLLNDYRHVEFLVHPYAIEGDEVIYLDPDTDPRDYYPLFKCLLTKRKIVEKPDYPMISPSERNPIATAINEWGGTFEVLSGVVNSMPKMIPTAVDESFHAIECKEHINVYHKIFIYDLDGSAGVAAEIAFPLEDVDGNYTEEHYENAINGIHRLCQQQRRQGKQYNTSGFSVRFVAKSNAYMSMMHGFNSCLIELDMLADTYGDDHIFHRYEEAMYEFGGRPHWGLDYDVLSGNNGLLLEMYPMLGKWYAVYRRFNRRGTFDNRFTNRMGFSQPRFTSPFKVVVE